MTDKQTYWLVDGAGTKAFVEGAAERDRWIPQGWAESTEPVGDEKLWVRFEGVAEPGQLPADAWREAWQAKGWVPSAPPEPVDPITGVRPAAPVPTNPTAAASAQTTTQAKPAAGGEKEKTRG